MVGFVESGKYQGNIGLSIYHKMWGHTGFCFSSLNFFPILAWFVQVFFVSDKFKILNLNSMVTGNYVIWRVHSSLKLSFGVGLGLGPTKSKASS